jgi:hypothetical protein
MTAEKPRLIAQIRASGLSSDDAVRLLDIVFGERSVDGQRVPG